MLDGVIRFSLRQRLFVVAVACVLLALGAWQARRAPIDVFPDLDRPRVTVMVEIPGMAPEEVETLVAFPLETALNGATGVESVRSSSAVGIAVVQVDFAYGQEIHRARQIVAERLQTVRDRLPASAEPTLAPVSSIMGQILVLGMWSEGNRTPPLELRTLADWVVRQRLLTLPGVAQIYVMGGGRKQFQVLVDPEALLRYGITLHGVKLALEASNRNATGGYLDRQGPQELLVRAIGRVRSVEDLQKVVVGTHEGRPVALTQVARVVEAPQVRRGDSGAFVREAGHAGKKSPAAREDDADEAPVKVAARDVAGRAAVVLTINKQPGADTRSTTDTVLDAVRDLQSALPDDVRIVPLYSQKSFIDRAVHNVVEALRDGGLLVVVVLFLFLGNLRTTFVTLTAIPLSLATTALAFAALGLSINTMTLGGLAVALGELVDDAIVDVENIFRRLKENRHRAEPLPALLVVFRASSEIRGSIVFGTLIVVLVFLPLFALGGMEGRLFLPLGIAYVVSILSSLAVSLTVTPVLSYWLLGSARVLEEPRDGLLLRACKALGSLAIRFSLRFPALNLTCVLAAVALAGVFLVRLERDFLPAFDEGAVQLNVFLPPGTSLATSVEVNRDVERQLAENPDVVSFVRRTGRAELDEHAEGVHASEYIVELDPDSPRHRAAQLEVLRHDLQQVPGIVSSVEQPISHLISHMLSGVKAQIGIKIFGDDLEVLRRAAADVEAAVRTVRGTTDVFVEQQATVPQLRIALDRDRLLLYGLRADEVGEFVETAMHGDVVSHVLVDQRAFDLLVRLEDRVREDRAALSRLAVELPDGGRVPLSAVARIDDADGPNTIQREQVRRRIVVQCNVADRGVVDVVREIRERIAPVAESLPEGYFVEYGGQFESQQSASRTIAGLSVVSLVGVFLVLYSMFRSVNLALQVMAALPMAFIGAVAALVVTGQTLTIAALVGFVSLAGIASRNGILLLAHYLHLVRHEGESFRPEMIVRAGLERLAPVLMTALTSGIGLVPLVLSAGEPGKEILFPVATVILGGLISSTLLDFFVHPALFLLFGIREAERVVAQSRTEIPLRAAED